MRTARVTNAERGEDGFRARAFVDFNQLIELSFLLKQIVLVVFISLFICLKFPSVSPDLFDPLRS